MKKITAIVRAEKLEVLKDALFAADVRGMTINQVQGCGAQHGWKEYVRGNELLVNTIPKVQFTLICADEHVDGIVEIICNAARTSAVGDGKMAPFGLPHHAAVAGNLVYSHKDHLRQELAAFTGIVFGQKVQDAICTTEASARTSAQATPGI